MTAIAQFPSSVRLNESFAFTLQFTAPADMADPATVRFDMEFQRFAGLGEGSLILSSDPGGGIFVGPMDPVARTFTVSVKVPDISAMIPVGVYTGYLRFTDRTGYREDLVVWPTATFVPF